MNDRAWETTATRRVLEEMPCPCCGRSVTEIDMQVQSWIPLREWAAGQSQENNGEVRVVMRPCGHWSSNGEITVDITDGDRLALGNERAKLAPVERGLNP